MQKRYLWLVYYQEKLWREAHHVYTDSLQNFSLTDKVTINGQINILKIEAGPHQFMVLIKDEANQITLAINQEGLISRFTKTGDE
jgi:RecJ-like exonuclease